MAVGRSTREALRQNLGCLSKEFFGDDLSGRVAIEHDERIGVNRRHRLAQRVVAMNRHAMIKAVDRLAERQFQRLKVHHHVVGVEGFAGHHHLDAAGVAMRKTTCFTVFVKHVSGLNRERAADAVHRRALQRPGGQLGRRDDGGVLFQRIVAVILGQVGDLVHDVQPFHHLPVDRVLAIEVRRGLVHDEKLTARRIGVVGAGRAQDSRRVRDAVEFLVERVARAAGAVQMAGRAVLRVGVAALDHKAGDDAVEPNAIVKAFGHELLKRLGVLRRDLGEKPQGDAPVGGVQDGDDVAVIRLRGGGNVAHDSHFTLRVKSPKVIFCDWQEVGF